MLQSLKARCVGSLLTVPAQILGPLWPGSVEIDDGRLEPGLAWLCRYVSRTMKLNELAPEQARRRMLETSNLLTCERVPLESVEDLVIGTEGPRVRVYSPTGLHGQSTTLVYFHGGGWVLGGLDSHDSLCALIAAELQAKLVAVDYRLAPEHPFPAAVHDARSAFAWTVKQAPQWGLRPDRVAVAGDSAGANLAAVVSAVGESPADGSLDPCRPSGQLLFYPVIDAERQTRSYELFAEGFGLTRGMMDWFYDCYCDPEQDLLDPRISPIAATDFKNLPPTVLSLAGFDVLRDEGLAYAEALRAAGVRVECLVHSNLIHSFANMTALPYCRRAISESLAAFGRLQTAG